MSIKAKRGDGGVYEDSTRNKFYAKIPYKNADGKSTTKRSPNFDSEEDAESAWGHLLEWRKNFYAGCTNNKKTPPQEEKPLCIHVEIKLTIEIAGKK